MKINKEILERDGFLLVKNVLTTSEVDELRKEAYATIERDKQNGTMFLHRFAKNHLGCLTNIPKFKNLVLHDKVLGMMTQVLGERPLFFGDAIFEIGIGNRGFHKDTSERKDENHPDWSDPNYPIYRVAFYLEDHKQHSGGLKVRVGSNKTVKTNVGKPVIIPSESGDAVIFSLKTSHAGNAVRLKIAPELSLHNSIEKRVPSFLKVPEEKERVSFFLTYGLPSGALDRYLNFMFNHSIYKQRIEASEYPDELVQEIKSKVNFLNVKDAYAKWQDSKSA